MKRYIGFLLALSVLMTGCSGGEVSPADSGTTAESTSEAPAETTKSDTSTTTAATTSSTTIAKTEQTFAPEETDAPRLEMLPVTAAEMPEISIIDEIKYNDIVSQIGYTTPVDITTLAGYEYTVEYASDDDRTDEQIADIKSRNYTFVTLNYQYLGNDIADWLIFAEYTLECDGPAFPFYTKGFYVNDGIVGEEVFSHNGGMMNIVPDGDNIFFGTVCSELRMTGEETAGLYCYNITDGTITKLDSAEWARVEEITDDYIVYSTGEYRVYDRSTGDIVKTGCYTGMQDGLVYYLHGDKFISHSYSITTDDAYPFIGAEDGWYQLDLITGEVEYLGEDDPADRYSYRYRDSRNESGRFYVELVYADDLFRTVGVSVKDKLTGETKTYSLISLAEQFTIEDDYENGIYVSSFVVNTSFLYMETRGGLAVLDLRTGEAAMPIGTYNYSRMVFMDDSNRIFIYSYGYEDTGAAALTMPVHLDGVDTELFSIVTTEELSEESKELFDKWEEQLRDTDLPLNTYIDCVNLGEYTIVYASGWYTSGNSCLVIMSEDDIHIIEGIDYLGAPRYFSYENSLFIYDDYLKNGIMHYDIIEYDLLSGEKLSSYSEYYDIGVVVRGEVTETNGISFNTDYKDFYQVQQAMLEMTDTLYESSGIENPLFEIQN